MGERSRSGYRDVIRRAVVTGAVVGLVAVGTRVPLPFVDVSGFVDGFEWATPRVTVLQLGLSPFIYGFLVVEITALAVPGLRRRRHGTFAERAPLVRAAWMLGVALCALQACGTVAFLRSARSPFGLPVVADEPWRLAAMALTLVAGSALAGMGVWTIGRRGLGNGFAILFAGLPVAELPSRLATLARQLTSSQAQVTPARIALPAAIAVLSLLLFARVLRAGRGAAPAVPAPTSGIVPYYLTTSLLLVPGVALGWFPSMRDWAEALHAGTRLYVLLLAVFTVAFTLLAARLFCSPRAVIAAWSAARGREATSQESESAVRLALVTATTLSVLLLLFIGLMPLWLIAKLDVPFWLPLPFLLIATAVVLDVGAEVRARLGGEELVSVYPLHRVYAVEPVLDALRRIGIDGHCRGRYFRAMEHFFGPYVPIEVLVPVARADEAREVCARIATAEPATTAVAPGELVAT